MRGISTTIAVGVDGSAPSLLALRWAVHTPTTRPADLIAVIATNGRPRNPQPGVPDPEDHRLSEVRQAIESVAGGTPIKLEVLEGNPTEVLLAMTDRVDLLVVGNHGYHGWRDAMAPSLSGKLAVRTRAALCVVQAPARRPLGRIVVGHDAATGTGAAEFAATEAQLRGATVLLVASWHYPWDTRPTSLEAAGILQEGATAAVEEQAAALRLSHPDVTVDTVVQLGQPVEVLAEFAGSADMVVVGSHGSGGATARDDVVGRHSMLDRAAVTGLVRDALSRSGLAQLVVGSVAIGLLHRLRTPVVIVPQA